MSEIKPNFFDVTDHIKEDNLLLNNSLARNELGLLHILHKNKSLRLSRIDSMSPKPSSAVHKTVRVRLCSHCMYLTQKRCAVSSMEISVLEILYQSSQPNNALGNAMRS